MANVSSDHRANVINDQILNDGRHLHVQFLGIGDAYLRTFGRRQNLISLSWRFEFVLIGNVERTIHFAKAHSKCDLPKLMKLQQRDRRPHCPSGLLRGRLDRCSFFRELLSVVAVEPLNKAGLASGGCLPCQSDNEFLITEPRRNSAYGP